MKFQLVKNNKVIFESNRKLDVIYEHIKYRRNANVKFVERA